MEVSLVTPFCFSLVGIPFGFVVAAVIHSSVALPRWLVEHGV